MENYRQWGPHPNKVTWSELCERKQSTDDSTAIFMSQQLYYHEFKGGTYDPVGNSDKILLALRPEDAIHVPMLRVDKSGKIIDWNRSMCDLTGISCEQVIGKMYLDVLEEWVPSLTQQYKQAAVDWLTKTYPDVSERSDEDVDCREDYLFPLPLPVSYNRSSSRFVSEKITKYHEYVELLVARVDNLETLYPKFTGYNGLKQYGVIPIEKAPDEPNKFGWFFDTENWAGGVEFTLRRKSTISTLQTLCQGVLPPDALKDGTLPESILAAASHASATKSKTSTTVQTSLSTSIENEDNRDGDAMEIIAKFVRTTDKIGLTYIREVLHHVCRKIYRNHTVIKRNFEFSRDWSNDPVTSGVNKHVAQVLGGWRYLEQTVKKNQMVWTITLPPVNSKQTKITGDTWNRDANRLAHISFIQSCEVFDKCISPVIAQNKLSVSQCGATDSTSVLPTTDQIERTVLTLKIEGDKRSSGGYQEEKFKATATVQVPATLNFFQLHRVVLQTMHCAPCGTRETHEWLVPNIASENEYCITDEQACQYIQLGETYFVESGRRQNYGDFDDDPFSRGVALRQRISRTGAFIDEQVPLFHETGNVFGAMLQRHSKRIFACIHTTCINSVFFATGTTAMLQDGLVKYLTKYKLTCMKVEQHDGPLPRNPELNVMLPKCLRGKTEEDDDLYDWSVGKANEQLEKDRGCLRRILCRVGSEGCMAQMPWCMVKDGRYGDHDYLSIPFAAKLTGLDHGSVYLYGEPPLPGSEEYEKYISTLDSRIDDKFRQEHVMSEMGYFQVPFSYGTRGRSRWSDFDDESDECIPGKSWTRDVDEEMQALQQFKPKAKGQKRKAAAAAGEKTSKKN